MILRCIDEFDNFGNRPHMLTNTSFHCRSNTERLMHANKVVVHLVERDGMNVILDSLAERIRQASEPPHLHAHGQVLALDVTRRNVRGIGIAENGLALGATDVDHITPIANGGAWLDKANTQCLWHTHHSQKTSAHFVMTGRGSL